MASTTYCLDQMRVVSHTYAHRDFFRNNQSITWFSRANRKQAIDEVVNRATRIRRYLELYDLDRVEPFGGDVEH